MKIYNLTEDQCITNIDRNGHVHIDFIDPPVFTWNFATEILDSSVLTETQIETTEEEMK